MADNEKFYADSEGHLRFLDVNMAGFPIEDLEDIKHFWMGLYDLAYQASVEAQEITYPFVKVPWEQKSSEEYYADDPMDGRGTE